MAKRNGTSGDDNLIGTVLDDVIHGNGGNDTIYGGAGHDKLYGDDGDDRINVQFAGSEAFGGTGRDTLAFHIDASDEKLQTNLDGGDGDDAIYMVFGSRIEDVVISGGEGRDLLYVFASNVDATAGTFTTGSVSGSFSGIEVFSIHADVGQTRSTFIGSDASEYISVVGFQSAHVSGGAGDDEIYSDISQGFDFLDGGDGNDTIAGYYGGDVIKGGKGIDTLTYGGLTSSSITVTLDDLGNGVVGNAIGFGDSVYSIENIIGAAGNDFIEGNRKANLLSGGYGNDNLLGGGGADELTGDSGADILGGGTGADTFRFVSRYDSNSFYSDVISDFSKKQGDKIELAFGDAEVSTFIGKEAFHGVEGEYRFEARDGSTFVQADFDGNGTADFGVQLTGLINLAQSDFIIG